MSDHFKHTAGFLANIGSWFAGWKLTAVNEVGSLACWLIGCIAGICTIHSWWKSQQKDK
jgi:hypothetical protein